MMNGQIKMYVISLYNEMPKSLYIGLFALLLIESIFIIIKGFKNGYRYLSGLLIVEYVFLLFCSTVLYRKPSQYISGYDFHLFWSYMAILKGRVNLLIVNIMNAVVFIPIGFLMCMSFRRIKWWQVSLIGCGISLLIEVLQFFTHRGFSELDDVLHNTLGSLVGFTIFKFFIYLGVGIEKK